MLRTEYVMFFIIYSFLGWVYESLYYSVQFKKRVNTGFLHTCFCPLYGFVCLLNILLFDGIQSNIKIFMLSMSVVSVMEYAVSWMLEKKFNKRWWDYSELPFNINGRISFFSSLAFGILSLVQIKVLHPFIKGIVLAFDERVLRIVSVAVLSIIMIDFVRTVTELKSNEDNRLWFVNEQSPIMHRATTGFNKKRHEISEKCCNVCTQIRNRIDR